MEKLYWLNRHYIKESPAGRLVDLAAPYFVKAGLMPERLDDRTKIWFENVVVLLAPSVDRLEQLPERADVIFRYDAQAAVAAQENAEALAGSNTKAVISLFTGKILDIESAGQLPLTAERFKAVMNEVKAESGAKGKELFHPVRIMLTESHSGPEFDKLIPILEEGSALKLPVPVLGPRQRVEAFDRVWQK
jgi:glutamyl-tRNA synthetase/nondiscriminating glutamyl-tRNA synthetase